MNVQASTILLPLATSICTILLIAYLFYLGVSMHGARRLGLKRVSVDLKLFLRQARLCPRPNWHRFGSDGAESISSITITIDAIFAFVVQVPGLNESGDLIYARDAETRYGWLPSECAETD